MRGKLLRVLTVLSFFCFMAHAQKVAVKWSDKKVSHHYFDYKVESGDNLSKIARKYYVTVKDIEHLNPQAAESLKIGTVLHIPFSKNKSMPDTLQTTHTVKDSSKTKPSTPNNIYVVKKGDTYLAILRNNHITDKVAFDHLNQLKDHNLKIGQKLSLPLSDNPAKKQIAVDTENIKTDDPGTGSEHIKKTKTDSAKVSALVIDNCKAQNKFAFSSSYPIGTMLTIVNPHNHYYVMVVVAGELPETNTYKDVQMAISCAAGKELGIDNKTKNIQLIVTQ